MAASTVVLLISMGTVSYSYECKYSGCRVPCKMMCFSSCRCYLNTLMLQLMAGAERLCHIFKWGRELISYFQMGLRDEKGWEPLGYRYAYGS